MKSQQIVILAGGVVVAAAVAFVVYRWRNPPPPPPADALVVLPGKTVGPFTLGMSRADAERARPAPAASAAASASGPIETVVAGEVTARLRDDRVVGVTAVVGASGVSLDGAWVPRAVDAPHTTRALAGSLRNCPEKKGASAEPRFVCYGTRFESAGDRAIVAIGTDAE